MAIIVLQQHHDDPDLWAVLPPWLGGARFAAFRDLMNGEGTGTPGAVFDRALRRWSVPANAVEVTADRLKAMGYGCALQPRRAFLDEEATLQQEARARARDILNSAWDQLVPRQQEGAIRLVCDSTLLAWAPGLGKTLTTLAAAKVIGEPGLIVAPAHTIGEVWVREATETWGLFHRADISQDPKAVGTALLTVVSYEALPKVLKALPEGLSLAFVAFDEIHYLKSPDAQRTRQAWRLADDHATRLWGLTGTLMGNSPMEAYTVCSLVRPKCFGAKSKFAFRYCAATLEPIPAGERAGSLALHIPPLVDLDTEEMVEQLHLRELYQRIRSMAYVIGEEAMADELPDLTIERVVLNPESAEQEQELRYFQRRIEQGDNTARRCFLEAAWAVKRTVVHARVQDDFDAGHRPAVLVWRRACAEELADYLRAAGHHPVVLTGAEPPVRRMARLAELRERTESIPVCTMDAVQTGIDLTCCNRVHYGELAFRPAVLAQSIKRFHRWRQTHDVKVWLYVVDQTLDVRAANILEAKINGIRATMGGGDTIDHVGLALRDTVDQERERIAELYDAL